jgi:hypothetical protein
MAQSYVGKCPVSKGIGTVIRKFVVLPFTPAAPDVSGERLRNSMDDCWRRRSHALRDGLMGMIVQLPVVMMPKRSIWPRVNSRNSPRRTMSPR